MNKTKKIFFNDLKYYGILGFWLCLIINKLYIKIKFRGSAKENIERRYYQIFHRNINWNRPETLNEKIQYLKLYGYEPFHTVCADKYRVREYLTKKFGNTSHQIPVLYKTDDWRDINFDNIPNEPCVIKANHTQGDVFIIKNKQEINLKKLRVDCRWWLHRNLYETTFEPQYKDIKPLIIVEKLLLTKDGKIPNDYKFHYFNGNLEFVYCSIDREGINKRNVYDSNWNPLYFSWSEHYKDASTLRGPEIDAPSTFEEMKTLGSEIAKDFKYVRVDYYEVDNNLYFGEITLHHGGGFDVFTPEEYDYIYGEKLSLS